jgi:hypothetical protein
LGVVIDVPFSIVGFAQANDLQERQSARVYKNVQPGTYEAEDDFTNLAIVEAIIDPDNASRKVQIRDRRKIDAVFDEVGLPLGFVPREASERRKFGGVGHSIYVANKIRLFAFFVHTKNLPGSFRAGTNKIRDGLGRHAQDRAITPQQDRQRTSLWAPNEFGAQRLIEPRIRR